MKKILLLLILPVLAILLFREFKKPNSLNGDGVKVSSNTSVILTSFGSIDSEGNWQGEVRPYMRIIDNTQDISNQFPLCEKAFKGKIFDQNVLIVITGRAKVRTSACVSDILHVTGGQVKEVILSGIAGSTPMKGGMVDSSDNLRDDEPAMIGDVCINSIAFDFDLQRYSSDQANNNQPQPYFWLPENQNPSNKVMGSNSLANELFQAALEVEWPSPYSDIQKINILYHGVSREPKPWTPSECLEISGDLFWHDIEADRRARIIGANWLSQVLGISVTGNDILVTTAMEAVPVGLVIEWWNDSFGTNISYAYVRGVSNFDHPWIDSNGIPEVSGRTSLESGFDNNGAEFAFVTKSLPIIKMFELRNK